MGNFADDIRRDRIRWTFRLRCGMHGREVALLHCALLFGLEVEEIEEIVKEKK